MRRGLARIAVGVLIAVTVVILGSGRAVRFPLDVMRAGSAPLESIIGRASKTTENVFSSFLHLATLAQRVRNLDSEVLRLRAEEAHWASVRAENEELRRSLTLLPLEEPEVRVAEVIGVTTDGVSHFLRINRGTSEGVSEGLPVIAEKYVLVGRVHTADIATALVEPLTSGQMRASVRTAETRANGLARGQSGLGVQLEGVPRTEELRVGDNVLTTGLDGLFPAHLLVGKIASIRAPQNAVFQEATIQTPLVPSQLRVVGVLLTP